MATRKNGGQIGEIIIEQLRGNIHAGLPRRQPETANEARGYADLLYLVTGYFYPVTDFIQDSGDVTMMMEIWTPLREDLLGQHVKIHPGTRPWGFYSLEDRPSRLRIDPEPCSCTPAVEHPGKLPPLNLSWFGRFRGCECEYEDEFDYLKRLDLLLPEEKSAIAEE